MSTILATVIPAPATGDRIVSDGGASVSTPPAGLQVLGDSVHRSWCKCREHERRIAAERRTHGDAAGWTPCVSRAYRAKAGRYTLTGFLVEKDEDAAPSISTEIIRDGKLAYSAFVFTLDELQAVAAFTARLTALASGE